ncbi:HAMP domain-containing sensor histidine kinase [Campylobacter geochelonis]|uniref:histidine kinase n=1 Tax=Campylobacter geochelonis TaxID=1780362 RepID=A0A128EKD5_9BACT|nr:HAMP domain-containing sensor histidine kinase [Campylobacter geochelonis]QKF71581.1 two-component system sensor histidine kinase [Campylobacter geochelonis]CZE49354.1 sensory trasnduction histidine kinase [Campylobacter geochelonis]
MLKIHQLFFINFGIIFAVMFSTFSFFVYKNQKDANYAATQEKLRVMVDIVDIAILDGSLNSIYIKDLARRSDVYIGAFDKELGKFVISDESIITMDIFLGLKDITQKVEIDNINDDEVMYYAVDTIIDDKAYVIVVGADIKSIYIKFKDLFLKLAVAFFICLFLSYLIAKQFNKAMNKELKKVQLFLEKVAQKDFSASMDSSYISEFQTIASQLEEMKRSIIKADKKAQKRAAKIRLKNTQLEGILSSISHEFKNPIAIIQASSQTLKNDSKMDDEYRDKFINKIVNNSQKIVNLMDKLKLSFTDSLVLNLSEFDLVLLSHEVANEMMEKYPTRKVAVFGDKKVIKADKDMIRQAVQNLVENAIKYSSDEVKVLHTSRGIFVVDEGVGISKENIALVSKKFFKVNENSWNNSLGLGLYIVKYILKLHNFEMIIKSELGKGSTFGFEC